jgi:hypothetical protein
MAWYKNAKHLDRRVNLEFDRLHEPGSRGGWSGIYRCEGCGREIVHIRESALPTQNHHQHTNDQGAIKWRLIVTDARDPY